MKLRFSNIFPGVRILCIAAAVFPASIRAQAPAGPLLERRQGPKYFAGGDCVNGGREVVDAVADGKRAALAIIQSFEVAHA